MASTNKTSLGLNMWEASDKPVRQDFVNDNVIVDAKISELNSSLDKGIAKLNSDLLYFKSYYIYTGASTTNVLPGLQEIYGGIPEHCIFNLLASFSGTLVQLSGFKVTDQYGVINSVSYAEGANKRYDIINGIWTLK